MLDTPSASVQASTNKVADRTVSFLAASLKEASRHFDKHLKWGFTLSLLLYLLKMNAPVILSWTLVALPLVIAVGPWVAVVTIWLAILLIAFLAWLLLAAAVSLGSLFRR